MIVANNEHLLRLEPVVVDNVLEDLLFATTARLVNGVDINRCAYRRDAQRPDFALLQATKPGSDDKLQSR